MPLEEYIVKEEIKSPMVGTFYDSPMDSRGRENGLRPDAYVKVGDRVHPKTVVCCIEAMMILNEIMAGTYGTIDKKLVRSGQPVDFDQPLFKIRPDD